MILDRAKEPLAALMGRCKTLNVGYWISSILRIPRVTPAHFCGTPISIRKFRVSRKALLCRVLAERVLGRRRGQVMPGHGPRGAMDPLRHHIHYGLQLRSHVSGNWTPPFLRAVEPPTKVAPAPAVVCSAFMVAQLREQWYKALRKASAALLLKVW